MSARTAALDGFSHGLDQRGRFSPMHQERPGGRTCTPVTAALAAVVRLSLGTEPSSSPSRTAGHTRRGAQRARQVERGSNPTGRTGTRGCTGPYDTVVRGRTTPGSQQDESREWARRSATGIGGSWVVFAAVLMIPGGLMTLFAGISTIANDDLLVFTRNYVSALLRLRVRSHRIGLDPADHGRRHHSRRFRLFQGATWARGVAVGPARPGQLANFLWLPYAPFWAIVLIAINGFAIRALCTPRSPSEN